MSSKFYVGNFLGLIPHMFQVVNMSLFVFFNGLRNNIQSWLSKCICACFNCMSFYIIDLQDLILLHILVLCAGCKFGSPHSHMFHIICCTSPCYQYSCMFLWFCTLFRSQATSEVNCQLLSFESLFCFQLQVLSYWHSAHLNSISSSVLIFLYYFIGNAFSYTLFCFISII